MISLHGLSHSGVRVQQQSTAASPLLSAVKWCSPTLSAPQRQPCRHFASKGLGVRVPLAPPLVKATFGTPRSSKSEHLRQLAACAVLRSARHHYRHVRRTAATAITALDRSTAQIAAICARITLPTSHTSADPVPDVEDKAEDHKDPSPTAHPAANRAVGKHVEQGRIGKDDQPRGAG